MKTLIKNKNSVLLGFLALPIFWTFGFLFATVFSTVNLPQVCWKILTYVTEILTIVVIAYFLWQNRNWRDMLKLRKPAGGWKGCLAGAVYGVLAFLVFQLLGLLLAKIGLPVAGKTVDQSTVLDWQNILTLTVLMPIITPIVEETFFRGAILSAFQEGFGKYQNILAVVLSSAVFGLAHFQGSNLLFALWIFVLALGFGWLTVKNDSIIPAIIGHATYNASMSLVVLATVL